jgi:hypothetical protein
VAGLLAVYLITKSAPEGGSEISRTGRRRSAISSKAGSIPDRGGRSAECACQIRLRRRATLPTQNIRARAVRGGVGERSRIATIKGLIMALAMPAGGGRASIRFNTSRSTSYRAIHFVMIR